MTHARLMLALVLAALLAASWLPPVARGAERPALAYALLANGQVVAISVDAVGHRDCVTAGRPDVDEIDRRTGRRLRAVRTFSPIAVAF